MFNGYGRHTANDLCHMLGFHPLMPASVICQDDVLFFKLLKELETSSKHWISPEFRKAVTANCNTNNPFAYDYRSADRYISFVQVYRCSDAKISGDLFKYLYFHGLLDPNHTIGASMVCNLPQVSYLIFQVNHIRRHRSLTESSENSSTLR